MTTEWIVDSGLFAGFKPPQRTGGTKFIVVHCSATKPDQDVAARDIHGWHIANGWIGCGYHFVIRRDGTTESARPIHMAGAHVEGHNHESVGICLAGGIDAKGKAKDNFTEDQYQALSLLLIELRALYPDAIIQGHRDFPGVKKDCPCFDVKRWVKTRGI